MKSYLLVLSIFSLCLSCKVANSSGSKDQILKEAGKETEEIKESDVVLLLKKIKDIAVEIESLIEIGDKSSRLDKSIKKEIDNITKETESSKMFTEERTVDRISLKLSLQKIIKSAGEIKSDASLILNSDKRNNIKAKADIIILFVTDSGFLD